MRHLPPLPPLHSRPLPYDEAALEDRCAPRNPVEIVAQLRLPGRRPFTTLVSDLSLAGFCAHCTDRLAYGAPVWLTLPGLEPLQAEVIWADKGDIGAAFARLLSPVVLDAILARHAAGLPPAPRRAPVRPV